MVATGSGTVTVKQVEVWVVWWPQGVRLVLLNRLRFGEYGGHRE